MFKKIALLAGPASFLLTLLFANPSGLEPSGTAVLACTLWMALWWVSEAVPIAVTALLPLILFPLSGAQSLKATGALYGHPIIFLFIGGFMLAAAIERWQVHRRIALNIIVRTGQAPARVILGFMIATAFLSMWISNTATTIMMVPIGLAIVGQLFKTAGTAQSNFAKALLLGIAYSASIGGIATLIGTPTNVIFTGVVQEQFGTEISFATWMLFAFPVVLVLLTGCWFYLTRIGFKLDAGNGNASGIKKELEALGTVGYEEKAVLTVFGLVAFGWVTRSWLINPWLPALNDAILAIAGAVSLFLIPSKTAPTKPIDTGSDSQDRSQPTLLDWDTAVAIPWGVILLFGGGLTLANAFKISGLAAWIGTQITLLGSLPLFVLLLLLIAAVNFLTEITSNIATVSMILPIVSALAHSIGIHPYLLMIGATCAASCAFMLPVATAPNAIVFGSKHIQIGDMIRAGIWLNIASIVIFSIYIYFMLPLLFRINLLEYPF